MNDAQAAPKISRRLVEVDALRGIAALSVVLFHYTTRYSQLFASADSPTVAFPHGYLGVNLFFIISGFVIFMTLTRTTKPMDFVVSRFSRLFPAFWAAIAITFVVTTVAGLPGKQVTLLNAFGNMLMFHGLLQVPHVDGVYWTLEVELLFYAGMLALFSAGRLRNVNFALCTLIGLRMVYHVSSRLLGLDLSWTLSRLLILEYIPWFALGICVYQLTVKQKTVPISTAFTSAWAITSLMVVDGWAIAALALFLMLLVAGAATGRLPSLGTPVLAFFGSISYPLYLLHENIGWVVQRFAQAHGSSFDVSIAAALATSVALATLLTKFVERPAMHAIRTWYRQRRPVQLV